MYESWFEVSDVAVATQERGSVLTRVMKTMLAMKLT
jgi:hypothetical protein